VRILGSWFGRDMAKETAVNENGDCHGFPCYRDAFTKERGIRHNIKQSVTHSRE
jgi:hypothetical protein